MKLSIVSTLYNSASYIDEFCHRASAAAHQVVGDDYEIVLVNDGSPDNSLEIAIRRAEADHHVVVLDLSRNFGHHKAMMTGLAHSCGEEVFLIDIDLEEEPEWLMIFSEKKMHERCDVVYGVQAERKGGFFERWSGHLYYKLFRLLSGLNTPSNETTARLMSRRYVDALLRFEEREIEIGALWYLTGFDQRPCLINKNSTSETTYTLRKKVALAVNAITSYSNTPLIWIFYLGFAILFSACTYALYLIVRRLIDATPVDGWTSLMVSVWLLGGLILSATGVIGIYLAKVYSETKRRPYTIIRQRYGSNKHEVDKGE